MHILNGLQLKDPSVSLFDVVETVEHHIHQRFTELAIQHTSAYIADIVDNPTARQDQYNHATLYWAARHIWEKESRKHDPFAFTISFARTPQRTVLALVHTPTDEYRTPLHNTNLFEEYAYSGNVEKPSYLSDNEWQQRAKDWWSLIKGKLEFRHLLQWELDTWATFYPGLDRDKNFDINEHITPVQRLVNMLTKTISHQYSLTPYLEQQLHEFITKYCEQAETIQLPPPIVSLRQKLGDLPEPFTPSHDMMQDIVNTFATRQEKQ